MDWRTLFTTLGTLYHWASPEVVGRMTLAQALMYMDQGQGRQEGKGMSREQVQKYMDDRRKLKGLG